VVFGLGGFIFGKALLQLHHALAPMVFALALGGFFGCGYLIRRYEVRLTVLAERALPGPLVVALHAKGDKVSFFPSMSASPQKRTNGQGSR
jgi:hypothetical protein